MDTEFFLTARNSQPWQRVAWGLFGSSLGAGVVFSISAFALYGGGIIGLAVYAISTGLPLVLVAHMGSTIKQRLSRPMSIASFARWRFGRAMQIYISLNVLFNLGVAMCVEYTAIGSLFSSFLGTPSWVPIVVVGTVTLVYTIAGGLYVSILTDQVQAIFTWMLLAVTGIYLCAFYRPGPMPAIPEGLGVTDMGWQSILTLGVAVTGGIVFSDAVWQRVWAAKDDRALKTGAYVASTMCILVAASFGLGGYFAAVYGLVDLGDPAQVNAAFFSIFKPNGPMSEVPISMLTVVCLLAATMNQSAIDSFQNAILDTILSVFLSFGFNISVNFARIVLIVINAPLMYVGVQGFNIVNLFLMTNTLTTSSLIPFILGLFSHLDWLLSGMSVLFGSLAGIFSVMVLGFLNYGSWSAGIYAYFYTTYAWQPFLLALITSTVATFIFAFAEFGIRSVMGNPLRPPAYFEKAESNSRSDTEVDLNRDAFE